MFTLVLASVPLLGQFQQREPDFDRALQQQAIDPQNRYGGLPAEKHEIYRDRSPLYNVDTLQIPLWNRVWTFLDWHLDPFHADMHPSTK